MTMWRREGLRGFALIGVLAGVLSSMTVQAEQGSAEQPSGISGRDILVAESPPPYISRDLISPGAPMPWASQSSATSKSSSGGGKAGAPAEVRNSATVGKANPELEKLTKDPAVKAAIDKAWKESRPADGGPRMEHGFWIVKDSSGKISVEDYKVISAKQDQITFDARPPPGTVASFHTHPNKPDEALKGFKYVTGPSPKDLETAKKLKLPGIIQSTGGMYYYDP